MSVPNPVLTFLFERGIRTIISDKHCFLVVNPINGAFVSLLASKSKTAAVITKTAAVFVILVFDPKCFFR